MEDARDYTVDELFSLGENHDVEHNVIPEAVELDLIEHDCNFTVEEVLNVQLLEANVTVPDVHWINREEQHALPNDINLPTAEEKLSDLFGNLKELQAHKMGRGVDKDEHGTWTNYKHVIRCWSKRKQVMKFEGKVSLEWTLLDGLTKKRKCTSKSFDTAEEAAKHADMVQVEKRGKHAWTNFPLSTYINNLEKDFLPTTVITRSDRTYYRAKASLVDSHGDN